MAPRIGSSTAIDYASSPSPSPSPSCKRNSTTSPSTLNMSSSISANAATTITDVTPPNYRQQQQTAHQSSDSNSDNSSHPSQEWHSLNGMTLDASSQYVGSVLKRQVGLLAGKTAKRRLHELRNTSRLPRAQHDFLSDHDEHHPEDDAEFDNLHKPMRLSWDEIFVEDMLGMGGFGSVCLVTCPKLRKQREREERAAANRRTGSTVYNDDASFTASFATTADDSSFGGSMMLSYASTTTATGHQQALDPNKYYACKSLSNKTIKQQNVRGFVQAASDLVAEAFLLSHINPHPNVVRLYGIPNGSIEKAFDCGSDSSGSDLGYFLILEALTGGILSDRVADWKQKQANLLREQSILRKRKEQKEQQQLLHRTNGSIPAPPNFPSLDGFLESPTEQSKSHTGRRNSINSKTSNDAPSTGNPEVYQLPTLEERLDIAHQIALGMQHLHAHGIVFRDLKPHNVGLSVTYNNDNNITNISNLDLTNSTVPQPHLTWRLFDFGLARELPRNQVGGGVCYGKAGSLRYMAPETMGGRWLRSSKHQNSSCFATLQSDVYAFAILLWELVGLQNFDKRYDANPEEFESAVCDRGHRPTMEALDAAIERDVGPLPSAAAEAARKYRHSNIRELVHACWREDYRHRPDFDFVVSTLKEMLTSEIENDQLDENENDPDDDNTVATDNLNESEMDLASFRSHQKPHSSQRIMNIQQIPSSMGSLGGQPLNRLSGHSYTSGSGRNRHRMLFRKPSHRSMSSRSMLSAHSVSTHSMVLEDVFEIDTEHSNSDKSSNRSSTKKSRDASLDDEDVDEDDFDDDESMANASLMNESVITISNRQKSSSRYLEYCADEGIEEEDEEEEDADDELEEEGDDGPPRVMHLAMNSVRERRGANGRGETTRYPPPLRGASSGSELTLYSTESSVDNRKNNRKNNRKS